MPVLHLIIHKEKIEDIFDQCAWKPDIDHWGSIISRIDEVEAKMRPHVKSVLPLDSPNGLSSLLGVAELAKGYDTVILYGCARGVCLSLPESKLAEAGKEVAYDIAGTSD
jgi:hypothetical protein